MSESKPTLTALKPKKELTPEQKEKVYQIYEDAFLTRLRRKGLLRRKPH
ncbi:MAG TPA: hypothetical protein PK983_03800 [Syntrophales bacterium]|nr:hypothetical protein [Syntrophales bacterium]